MRSKVAPHLKFTVRHQASQVAVGTGIGTIQAALLYGDIPTHMKTALAFAERAKTKFQTIIAVIVVIATLIAGIALIMISGLVELKTLYRVLLIVVGFVVMVTGIGVAVALELTCGAFECRKCGHRFVPSIGAYLMGAHSATTRHLKCPKCGKRSWAKRRMSLVTQEEEEQENKQEQNNQE